jgi:hypothetical protein
MAFANDDLSEEERARFGRMYDDARKGQREAYETWPDPVSLPAGLSPVEPFKPEVLPPISVEDAEGRCRGSA